jgi:hypothetical protein
VATAKPKVRWRNVKAAALAVGIEIGTAEAAFDRASTESGMELELTVVVFIRFSFLLGRGYTHPIPG